MNSTLDNWLNIKSNFIKKNFVLDWSKEIPNAYWTDTKPENFTFTHRVNWKEKRDYVFLYGIFKKSDTRFFYGIEEKFPSSPYLKSHLQKCVRRKMDRHAVKTMKHLIRQDVAEAIRRLAIVMIEDVEIMFHSLKVLAWLTSAISNKDFFISRRMAEWLLGVVSVLSKHEKHINYIHDERGKENEKITKLNFQVIRSLEFRISYGGMKVDQYMIKRAIEYHKCCSIFKEKCVFVNWDSVKDLKLEEWELSAIDFHICSILKPLSEKFPNFKKEKLKRLIWDHKSGVNYRDNEYSYVYSKTEIKEYNIIKKELEKLSSFYLKIRFN